MYDFLKILHSLMRYGLLIAAVYALYRAYSGWQKNTPYSSADNKASVFLIIFVHSQLLLGLLLYFQSPWTSAPMNVAMKIPELRYWKVEHFTMMIIVAALFQVGRSISKKGKTDLEKHKKAAIFYTIAFALMMISIPWPFMKVARPWLPF